MRELETGGAGVRRVAVLGSQNGRKRCSKGGERRKERTEREEQGGKEMNKRGKG